MVIVYRFAPFCAPIFRVRFSLQETWALNPHIILLENNYNVMYPWIIKNTSQNLVCGYVALPSSIDIFINPFFVFLATANLRTQSYRYPHGE